MTTLTAGRINISDKATTAITPTQRGVAGTIKRIMAFAVNAYQVSQERRELTKLSSRQLRDIGVTRQQVHSEVNRSFFDVPVR